MKTDYLILGAAAVAAWFILARPARAATGTVTAGPIAFSSGGQGVYAGYTSLGQRGRAILDGLTASAPTTGDFARMDRALGY